MCKRFPCTKAYSRPACHVESHVIRILLCVAGKDRETHVVAYLKQELHTTELHDLALLTTCVTMVLTTEGEEMMLVVVLVCAIRFHEVETVVVSLLAVSRDTRSHASSYGSIHLLSSCLHPVER